MREKLIELIEKGQTEYYNSFGNNGIRHNEYIADYLIANGVIVPPCKVGDVLYEAIWQKKPRKLSRFRKLKVAGFHMGDFPVLRMYNMSRENYLIVVYEPSGLIGHIPFKKIGKTVFQSPSIEEAEKALDTPTNTPTDVKEKDNG